VVSELSLHDRGATTIRTDYTQLGIPNQTTYVALNPCICQPFPQILHNVNRSTLPGSTILLHPASSLEGIRYSHHLPRLVRDCLFTYGIAGSGLPEHVASCKVSPHQAYIERSLIDTDGLTFLLNVWSILQIISPKLDT
jgi:hypothetical protein